MKTKLVIFGITGDLSRMKLLPALERVIGTAEFADVSVVGVSRRHVDLDELLGEASVLSGRTSIYAMDLAQLSDYIGLVDHLALASDDQALIYLAVPPSAAAQIVNFLALAHLNTANIKILFEKPFGFDLASAQDLIDHIDEQYDEQQVYRVDHYMAKSVASDLIWLRTGVDSTKGTRLIASVDIVASETLSVEHRAQFYEQTGALRDVVQGHLLQLLSLVLMPVPDSYEPRDLPDYRLAALNHITPADPTGTIRAQYDGYQSEVGNVGSTTETFVSVLLSSNDPDYLGVPLRLTTGKALREKQTSVTISYTDGTKDVLQEPTDQTSAPDGYERVLMDAMTGNKSIFTTSPEIIRAWEILAPIQSQWAMDASALKTYPRGSTSTDIVA